MDRWNDKYVKIIKYHVRVTTLFPSNFAESVIK
jgi:hypothetical protein